jgi:WXXGXW repeat (2 copies)
MKRTLTLASLIAVSAAAWLPLPSMAQNGINVVITSAPPAPRFESVPAPRRGYVWAPGYWNWEGNRHVWMSGHWEAARDGYQYQSSEWIRDNQGYRLRQGGWQPVDHSVYNEIRIAPPAPRYERIPRGRPGYVWEPGHWEWRGRRYAWVSGVWIAERPGYVYSQANWIERDGRWSMEPPRWTPRGRDRDHDGIPDRMEHHDRDHDGIPDRFDHDRDNDGVPNRRDGDRDGDGVPNDRDYRPDNPRRN